VRLAVTNPLRAMAMAAALCTLALAACATQPGGAKAARGMEIALQDDPVFVTQDYFKREKAFAHARSLGVTRLRVNANWAFTLTRAQQKAKKKPAGVFYNFGQLDSVINAAAAHGIRVHLSATGPAPAWAAGNKKLGNYKPNQKEFAAFVTALARHEKGRVDRYSIWNEPNWIGWLSPLKSGASQYRGLYTRGYKAIKAADPKAKVLIGETAPYAQKGRATAPLAFLRGVACLNKKYKRVHKCAKLKADGYGHHPYYFQKAPSFKLPGADNATMGTLSHLTRGLDRIARTGQIRRNGGGKLGIYLTEFGYFSSGHRALSKSKRGKYTSQGFKMALANGRVKSQLYYLLVQPPRKAAFAFFDLGLLTRSGKKNPQYNALAGFFKKYKSRLKRPGSPIVVPPPSP
jgi:Cellulase (glycosyl hydrolase family 5)